VDLLKPNDVAKKLAVSRAWVYEAARTGRIPSVRIGGDDGPLRFVPEDVDAWLAEARASWSPTGRTSEANGGRRDSPPRRRRDASRLARGRQPADQQSLL
jgi:excisionase family DNA binding protein